MIKRYCDMCGKEVARPKTVWFGVDDNRKSVYYGIAAEEDCALCNECYHKVLNTAKEFKKKAVKENYLQALKDARDRFKEGGDEADN